VYCLLHACFDDMNALSSVRYFRKPGAGRVQVKTADDDVGMAHKFARNG
jgi:hypothetical protein